MVCVHTFPMLCYMCKKPSTRKCCEYVSYCSVECQQSHWFACHSEALCHVLGNPRPEDYLEVFMKTSDYQKLWSYAHLFPYTRLDGFIIPEKKLCFIGFNQTQELQRHMHLHVVTSNGTQVLSSLSIKLR